MSTLPYRTAIVPLSNADIDELETAVKETLKTRFSHMKQINKITIFGKSNSCLHVTGITQIMQASIMDSVLRSLNSSDTALKTITWDSFNACTEIRELQYQTNKRDKNHGLQRGHILKPLKNQQPSERWHKWKDFPNYRTT